MQGFTGIKDLDKELMLSMDDREFIRTCTLNKYFQGICKDDYLFKRRLERFYPDTIEAFSRHSNNWKEYYVKVIKTISLLKEKYDFNYIHGNPFLQMSYFKTYKRVVLMLLQAIKDRYLPIILHISQKYPRLFKQQYINTLQELEDQREFPNGTVSLIKNNLTKS